ncbi:GTP-binding protein [Ancylobacter sonchi]
MERQWRPGGDAAVPIYLLTGFLGSGKTTLLRRLLSAPELSDTALIINEFGEVGLDHKLVQSSVENVLLMEDGCLCCSVRGDLIDVIGDLFAGVRNGELPAFSRIVIETTGLADPTAIVQDLTTARGLAGLVRLEKVIVTVDGVLGGMQIAGTDEMLAQAAQADLCVVTKCDIADLDQVLDLVGQLRAVNPLAEILTSDDEAASPAAILDLAGPPMTRPPRRSAFRCDGGEACTHAPDVPCTGHALKAPGGSNMHRKIQSWSMRHDEPLSWPRLRNWLDLLYSSRPSNLLRMKGIVRIDGVEEPMVIHGVGAILSRPEPFTAEASGVTASELVVITTDLPAEHVEQTFRALVIPG